MVATTLTTPTREKSRAFGISHLDRQEHRRRDEQRADDHQRPRRALPVDVVEALGDEWDDHQGDDTGDGRHEGPLEGAEVELVLEVEVGEERDGDEGEADGDEREQRRAVGPDLHDALVGGAEGDRRALPLVDDLADGGQLLELAPWRVRLAQHQGADDEGGDADEAERPAPAIVAAGQHDDAADGQGRQQPAGPTDHAVHGRAREPGPAIG